MFSESLWNEWCEKELRNYEIRNNKRIFLKKGYLHFDDTFWFPDKKLIVKNVIENGLKERNKITSRLERRSFTPFLKLLVKTPRFRYQEEFQRYDLDTKIRPLCFASHFDSLIFGYYSFYLSKKYEEYIKQQGFSECVLAYRTDLGKSNIQFAKEVFDYIKIRGECTAIALDIKGYFDHIDHGILKSKWLNILNLNELPEDQFYLYKLITKYSYSNKNKILSKYGIEKSRDKKAMRNLLQVIPGKNYLEKFNRLKEDRLITSNTAVNHKGNNRGIPQGSAMSSVLSNIYMIDYDKMFHDLSQQYKFLYRRYCDDIIIVCDTKDAKEYSDLARKTIDDNLNLEIQEKKVEMIDFRINSHNVIRGFKRDKGEKDIPKTTNSHNENRYYKPLQYLGFEFTGQTILIRSSSLSRYFRKMNGRIEKTVSMSYSPNSKSTTIFKKQLFEKYTHLGKRNFISYAYKASQKTYKNSMGVEVDGMDSLAIRRQVKRHFSILVNKLNRQNITIYKNKVKNQKFKKPKSRKPVVLRMV
jgi:RNA-directed DNA polymerase